MLRTLPAVLALVVLASGCAGARLGVSVPVGIGGVGVSVGTDGRVGGSAGVGRGGVGVGVGGTMSLPRNEKHQDPAPRPDPTRSSP